MDFSLSVPSDFSSASRPGESDSENLLIERIDTAVGSLLTQAACSIRAMTSFEPQAKLKVKGGKGQSQLEISPDTAFWILSIFCGFVF